MPTVPGSTRIGPYEIHREIGRGGMGVVYAARDTRLDREVAVKALPDLLARHPDRLARFQREARLLASLNHPHIASIHGLEEIDGRSYLVLEYVDGETLEDLLKRRGALPVDEALALALQIARAVEAAHERGVIHRDLKPANIKINSAGDVKVLDFGLAKALDPAGSLAPGDTDITQPPPGSTVATIPGLVLGSPGYLSPEQARGQPADRRTDVFSFGCLLYEMLTGTSLFAGQSIGDSIGATLYKDPDWSALPPATPPTVRLLLRRCLKKDPRQRIRDMADARLDLEEAIADPTGSMLNLAAVAYAAPRHWRQRAIPALIGVLLLGAGVASGWLGGAAWRTPDPAPPVVKPVVRFEVPAPAGMQHAGVDELDMNSLAISADGSLLAFTVNQNGEYRVWVRDLASGESREIPAARGCTGPFFSPDGRWLAFFNENRLLKVSLDGGPASPVCQGVAPLGRAAWLRNGKIVFTGSTGDGLYSVSADGGEPMKLAGTDRAGPRASSADKPILGFGGAAPLPDGSSVIAPIWDGSTLDDYHLVVVNTETGQLKRVVAHAAMPAVLDAGFLVFLRNATLLAVEFDLDRLEAVGQPVPVLEGVAAESWGGDAKFALAPNGTLAYAPGGRTGEERRLILLDRGGKPAPLDGPDAFVGNLSVSPDGRYITIATLRRKLELWAYDLERRTMTLVQSEGESYEPVWSPDGTQIAFTLEGQNPRVVRKAVFSSAPPQVLIESGGYYPSDWTPDGTSLLLTHQNWRDNRQTDIVTLDLAAGGASPATAISTSAGEGDARISPDGRWILYSSDVSMQREVYLAAYPFDGRHWQISVGGASRGIWDGMSGACFVSDEGELLEARLTLAEGSDPVISTPQRLFDLKPVVATSAWNYLARLPDGGFVAIAPAEWETQPSSVVMVVNWGEQLARKVRGGSAQP